MKLVNVYSAAGNLEAEMIKGFLEAQGIEVVLSQESVGRTMGLTTGMLGRVQVLVSENDVDEAKGFIGAIADGEYEHYDTNDSTGEQNNADS